MKKILILLVGCFMILGLTGCSHDMGYVFGMIAGAGSSSSSSSQSISLNYPVLPSETPVENQTYPYVMEYNEGECNFLLLGELYFTVGDNNCILKEEDYEDYVIGYCSESNMVTGQQDYYEIRYCSNQSIQGIEDVINLPEADGDYLMSRVYENDGQYPTSNLYGLTEYFSEYETETLFVFNYNNTFYSVKTNNEYSLPGYVNLDEYKTFERQTTTNSDLVNEENSWCESLTIYPMEHKVECVLAENADGDGYLIRSITDEAAQNTEITVFNEIGEIIQTLQQVACPDENGQIPELFDYNGDGYLDMRCNGFYYAQSYEQTFYVWNPTDKCFELVTCDGELADIEVREGKIWSWVRSGDGYMIEVYAWDGLSHLVKESEEYVEPDVQ